jgi:hypothetical protein
VRQAQRAEQSGDTMRIQCDCYVEPTLAQGRHGAQQQFSQLRPAVYKSTSVAVDRDEVIFAACHCCWLFLLLAIAAGVFFPEFLVLDVVCHRVWLALQALAPGQGLCMILHDILRQPPHSHRLFHSHRLLLASPLYLPFFQCALLTAPLVAPGARCVPLRREVAWQ